MGFTRYILNWNSVCPVFGHAPCVDLFSVFILVNLTFHFYYFVIFFSVLNLRSLNLSVPGLSGGERPKAPALDV